MSCTEANETLVGVIILSSIGILILGVMTYSLHQRSKLLAYQIKRLSNIRLVRRR